MKLNSSPSSSSSSSTSISSTTTFSGSGIFPTTKGSLSGCLSFVLRSLLCSSKLPTKSNPSDHLTEINLIQYQSMKPQKTDDSPTPNLVARLMGLDSLPDTNTNMELASITRSKSTSSMDVNKGQHRRVKTSVSFETPSYFEMEDDDFFVISFDNGGKNRKPASRKTKPDMGGRGNEQRRRGRVVKEHGRRPRFKISDTSDEELVLEIENCGDGGKKGRDHIHIHRRRKKDKCLDLEGAKVEIESESENSSPVSVLDHSLFISDHQVPNISEEDARNRSSSPRRKLASELSNLKNPSSDSNNETCPIEKDQSPSEATKGKQSGSRRKGCQRHQNMEMLNQVWRLAEVEVAEYDWKCKGGLMRNLKKWEAEIGVELSLQIVDQLVDEVVHQLI